MNPETKKTFDKIDDPLLRMFAVACYDRDIYRRALERIEMMIQMRRSHLVVESIIAVIHRAIQEAS